MNRRHFSVGLALVALSLCLTACNQSAVTTTLDLIVTAADTAIGVLSSTGTIPAPIAALIEGYLGNVTDAVQYATTELASTDDAAIKATKIAAEFAMIAKPNLTGLPLVIANVIDAVATSIQNFLSTLATSSAEIQVMPKGAQAFFASPKAMKVSKRKLDEISAHAAKVKAKLAALPKKR